MPTNTTAFSVGDVTRLTAVFKSTDGTPTNSDVTLIVNTPSGGVTVLAATSTGSTALTHTTGSSGSSRGWQYDYLSTEAGRYTWRWESTGTIQASTGGAWAVYPQKASS